MHFNVSRETLKSPSFSEGLSCCVSYFENNSIFPVLLHIVYHILKSGYLSCTSSYSLASVAVPGSGVAVAVKDRSSSSRLF